MCRALQVLSYCSFLLLVLMLIQHAFCQSISDMITSDTLNRLNSSGKRIGYWIEYVDERLKITKKDKAIFIRYVYYENGYRTSSAACINFKATLKVDGNQPIKDSVVLMDGIFRIYNRKGKLRVEESYNKGKTKILKSYYPRTGQVVVLIDYTKPYKNQEWSAHIEEYNRDGSLLLKGYHRKIGKKWKVVPLDYND